MYTLGMEEEYFLFDAKTRHAVRRVDKRFLSLAQKQLGSHVMTEMLQSQIEVATPPCACTTTVPPSPLTIRMRCESGLSTWISWLTMSSNFSRAPATPHTICRFGSFTANAGSFFDPVLRISQPDR